MTAYPYKAKFPGRRFCLAVCHILLTGLLLFVPPINLLAEQNLQCHVSERDLIIRDKAITISGNLAIWAKGKDLPECKLYHFGDKAFVAVRYYGSGGTNIILEFDYLEIFEVVGDDSGTETLKPVFYGAIRAWEDGVKRPAKKGGYTLEMTNEKIHLTVSTYEDMTDGTQGFVNRRYLYREGQGFVPLH